MEAEGAIGFGQCEYRAASVGIFGTYSAAPQGMH